MIKKEVVLFKKHLKNIMNGGNGLTQNDLKLLFKEVVNEMVERKIRGFLETNSLSDFVNKAVSVNVNQHINSLIRKQTGRWNFDGIEEIVRKEAEKQITEFIRSNLTIEVKQNKEV